MTPLSILDALIDLANGEDLPDGALAACRGQGAAEALSKMEPKRLGAKLREMLLARRPARAVRILLETGLVKGVFNVPEAENVGDLTLKVGEEDVCLCDHLADVVKVARKLLEENNEPKEVRVRVMLAAMLHDYAKADPRYLLKHEEMSSKIADAALRRLGFSLKDRNAVERAILLHMGCCNEDGVEEFIKECETPSGNFWKETMYLKIADPLSKGFDDEAEWRKKIMKKVEKAAKDMKVARWVRGNCRFAQTEGPSFYRGHNPDETKRIDEPFDAAKGKLFVARNSESAKFYGKSIERVQAKPGAKILYEGTLEFGGVWGKKRYDPSLDMINQRGQDETIVSIVNTVVRRAILLGYDAVSFKRDSDIGTVILNEQAFVRGLKP